MWRVVVLKYKHFGEFHFTVKWFTKRSVIEKTTRFAIE